MRSTGIHHVDLRYRVGLHHVPPAAPTRAARNGTSGSARARRSGARREYGHSPGYYAVVLYDPDGIKLELVHVPGFAAQGSVRKVDTVDDTRHVVRSKDAGSDDLQRISE